MQIIDVFSTAVDGNYRKQIFYKNHGFAKVVLILACDASNEADQTMSCATKLKEDVTTSNKNTKKIQQHLERKEWGEKENVACLIILLYIIKTVIECALIVLFILLLYTIITMIQFDVNFNAHFTIKCNTNN